MDPRTQTGSEAYLDKIGTGTCADQADLQDQPARISTGALAASFAATIRSARRRRGPKPAPAQPAASWIQIARTIERADS